MKNKLIPTDMRQAIEVFFAKAEAIVNSFARTLDKQPPPSIIYHYTNDAGLRGILETGKFWLTDIFNLNDPTELRHGLNPAMEIMAAEARKGRPEVKKFSTNLDAMLQGGIEQVAHFFVGCFSKAEDDLGQWRAYADNGRGYAIGFDAHMLEQAFIAKVIPGPGLMTFPVSYGEDELREMHRQIIAEAVPLISMPRGRKLSDEAINAYMTELSVSLSVPILRAALFFKHKAYSHEEEYRFLQLFMAGPVVPDLKYRVRPHSLIRYREFDWRNAAPESLRQVKVGPAADKSVAFQFVGSCLREFCRTSGDVSINSSTIPYRVL